MGHTRISAFDRTLSPRFAVLLVGVSLLFAGCSTGDPPGRDYSSGTVQIQGFRVRTGEFAALAYLSSDPDRVGSGVLTEDGQFSWNLITPPEMALVNAAHFFGEGVTAVPADVQITMVHEFYDESTEDHIEHAVFYGTSSGLDVYEQGTRSGVLMYADKNATLGFAGDYEKGTVPLSKGWNVLAMEMVGIDVDGFGHVRYTAGTSADLYFYHHYRDWAPQ